tara:strand:+ start:325 stop:936 length:612 start_codon:yes stop_codon:yes gene_type:complete
MKKKLIIFDLDGVLINSLSNMEFALNKTSKNLEVKLNFKLYKKYLGLPFKDIMKKMRIKKNVNLIKEKYEMYSTKKINKIKIKRKHIDILKKLKKSCYLALFTSKNKKRTLKIVQKDKIFDCIITSDDVLKGKPHPEGLYKILKKLKIKKKNSVYVGDSFYDYKASKLAKIKYAHAMWGYDKSIGKNKNIIKLNRFRDISRLI